MDVMDDLLRLGMAPGQARAAGALFARADAALDAAGAAGARWSVWVPGRLEVLGKHTDYCGGRSLLCAVERGFAVRVAARADAQVRAWDATLDAGCTTALDAGATLPAGTWGNYVATVARRLARNFPDARLGVDLAFASDLPVAAGLSSSSALMIAVFVALAKSNDLRSSEAFRRAIFTREELAAYLGAVENGAPFHTLAGDAGVGTMGGCQDHTAIMCAEPGRLVRYGFSPPRREGTYPVPASHTFVVASCGVPAEKTAGARAAYNRAATLVQHLLRAWRVATGRDDATLADAVRSAPDAADQLRALAARAYTDEAPAADLLARLEHFLLESRVLIPMASERLARGALDDFGTVVDQSQGAAERWLGNQVPETIALARAARRLGATAASAFGAGFGGSVWALVPAADADAFREAWARTYAEAFPARAEAAGFFTTGAGIGAQQF